jgi:hypothetical protein
MFLCVLALVLFDEALQWIISGFASRQSISATFLQHTCLASTEFISGGWQDEDVALRQGDISALARRADTTIMQQCKPAWSRASELPDVACIRGGLLYPVQVSSGFQAASLVSLVISLNRSSILDISNDQ